METFFGLGGGTGFSPEAAALLVAEVADVIEAADSVELFPEVLDLPAVGADEAFAVSPVGAGLFSAAEAVAGTEEVGASAMGASEVSIVGRFH